MSETQRASGVVAILHESARMTLETLPFNRAKSIVLIVGPEGGITKDELTALETAGGQAVIMGPTVLRSAAAGAVALGAMGVLTERWEQGKLKTCPSSLAPSLLKVTLCRFCSVPMMPTSVNSKNC